MSESEGIHGISAIRGQSIPRFPPPTRRLRPNHSANPLPTSRPSILAADLCLARLRLVSPLSGPQSVPGVLAGEARGTTVLGHGCALALDQARRATLDQRRVPVALTTSLDRQMRFVARPRHIFLIPYARARDRPRDCETAPRAAPWRRALGASHAQHRLRSFARTLALLIRQRWPFRGCISRINGPVVSESTRP